MAMLSATALTVLIVGLCGSARESGSRKCTGIDIRVLDGQQHKFLTDQDIRNTIDRNFGGYINRPVDSVRLHKIERTLAEEVFLDSYQAYFTNDGVLHIEVSQCQPVAKRMKGKELQYMNRHGAFTCVSEDWCEVIPVIEGSFGKADALWNDRFGALALQIANSQDWKDRVCAYEIYPTGEIALRLIDREERFVLGEPTDIAHKLSRIKNYEKNIAPYCGKDKKYTTITVKYTGQIVCI